jgi:hypothetical protein
MNNRPWIDPRDVDWIDSLSGVGNPGYRRINNPYVNTAVNDQFMQALRLGKGIEPRIFVCPDPSNQSVPAGATFDYEVPSEPNTWLWAVCASLGNPVDDVSPGDGFLVQITDSSTGATLLSQPVNGRLLTGIPGGTPAGSGNGYRGPLFVLSTPHLFQPPSYPVVRIVNVSAALLAICRVTLFTAVEYDV